MSLCWNSRIIADVRLSRVHGMRVTGGFGLRLGMDFSAPGWPADEVPPQMQLMPSAVYVGDSAPMLLGRAFPETPRPVLITGYGSGTVGALFEVVLSGGALEAVERIRNGRDLRIGVKLQAQAHRGAEVLVVEEDASKTFGQSEWLNALEQSGFSKTLLFEIQVPDGPEGSEPWARMLERARSEFFEGRFSSCVGSCRLVLESLTASLGQEPAMKTARELQKKDRTVEQRELMLRQAAMDYSSPSHHMDSGHPDDLYDRKSAQLLLGITAGLVRSALARLDGARRRIASES